MTELAHKELSYKINGILYKADNLVGAGQSEKTYCNAIEELFKEAAIKFKREIYYSIKVNNKVISKQFFDFLVEDCIVLEIKTGNYMYRNSIDQVFQYLKNSKLQLGLIARFAKDGVQIKRVLNIRSS